ncbi:uroporphyrinogen-III C-methyltransferase [Clostridium oceanicum]|uniref:uroporphyrinogen-III C-methyltransferase n=1 Tax=Clostridium oceanicum TaxID=1543 RepID=A0ABN1JGB2_9CLOT
MGKVYLIGAGPGDEELITLKGVRALKKCTAVLYDRLANRELLKYLKEDCKVYFCGKIPGCHYKNQDEINNMIVKLAKEGHTVGRLKGGDPYVFGRGGEEVLKLLENNINFEVVPGITSSIAVLNYAGIPVTHRDLARSFHVFTGKTCRDFKRDWKSIASIGGTLIFLMGVSNLENISDNLLKYGMDRETKVSVIMKGTTSEQKKVVGNLENIITKVKDEKISSPAIIVVGEVVSFHDKFDWLSKKPLSGKNICITRTKEQAKGFKKKLLELGAEVTEINSIKIKKTPENLDKNINNLEEYNYILFTSVNAVEIFFEYIKEKKYDIRNIKAKIGVIGPKTSEAVMMRGIIPAVESEHFVAESLFESMKKVIKNKDKILIPRSKQARPFLPDALREEGCIVDEIHLYEVLCGKLQDKSRFEKVDTVIFTSPSTVRNMISMVGLERIKNKEIIAIGPITEKELNKNNIECKVAKKYSIEGIIDLLLVKN